MEPIARFALHSDVADHDALQLWCAIKARRSPVLDADRLQAALGVGWLAFCAYTWIAPSLFRRMLELDLGKVELSKDY